MPYLSARFSFTNWLRRVLNLSRSPPFQTVVGLKRLENSVQQSQFAAQSLLVAYSEDVVLAPSSNGLESETDASARWKRKRMTVPAKQDFYTCSPDGRSLSDKQSPYIQCYASLWQVHGVHQWPRVSWSIRLEGSWSTSSYVTSSYSQKQLLVLWFLHHSGIKAEAQCWNLQTTHKQFQGWSEIYSCHQQLLFWMFIKN